jgi:Domain of unknown function (DUF4062)
MRLAGSGGSRDDVRWRVFISHTSELRDFPRDMSYVAAVERAISAAGHVIVDMADFAAADQAPALVCAERVRGCEVYVGVLGTRYGSPVPDKPKLSYTELEFDTATEAGLYRLVFLLDADAKDVGIPPSSLIDREFGDRQDAFRRRVRDSGLLTQTFANPAELGQKAERSLRELAQTRHLEARGPLTDARSHQATPLVRDYLVEDYVEREEWRARVDSFLSGPGGYLVVEGPAGVGKTTFLAHLAQSCGYPYGFIEGYRKLNSKK